MNLFKKIKEKIDIISLILVIITTLIVFYVSELVLLYKTNFLILILGYLFSIVFMSIYIHSKKNTDITNQKKYSIIKFLIILYFIGIFLCSKGVHSYLNMENYGIDGIGEAIIYGFMIKIGSILTIINPIIILIINYGKKIFKIKNLIIVLILIITFYILNILFTTTKVSKNIPTVGDFQEELVERELLSKTTNYKLYGISNKKEKITSLSFEDDYNSKYPLYVFVVDNWIIYYANGYIYAVYGEYEYENGKEEITWIYPNTILSENKKIAIYNMNLNLYIKTNSIYSEMFSYNLKDKELKNFVNIDTVNIDIPKKLNGNKNLNKIDRIDKENINKYSKEKSLTNNYEEEDKTSTLEGYYEIVVKNYDDSNKKIYITLDTNSYYKVGVFKGDKDDPTTYHKYEIKNFSEKSMQKIYSFFNERFYGENYKIMQFIYSDLWDDDTKNTIKAIIECDESYITN